MHAIEAEEKSHNGLRYLSLNIPATSSTAEIFFTNRLGGISNKPYDSLNLGLHVGDDERHVLSNRERIAEIIGLNHDEFVVPQQVHSSNIYHLAGKDKGRGARNISSQIPDTDALICSKKDTPLMMLYADCIPVVLTSIASPVVALIHAGWKGTASQIAIKTAAKISSKYIISPGQLAAVIGPGIGPCCYQTGSDVAKLFPDESTTENNDATYLDLKLANKMQLVEFGIPDNQIYVINECTSCDQKYFSYRRDKKVTGRNSAIVVIH